MTFKYIPISSMKIIHGRLKRALSNRMVTFFSASPTNDEYSSAAETNRKFILSENAIALAKLVFAQPGGPYNRIPKSIITFERLYKNRVASAGNKSPKKF